VLPEIEAAGATLVAMTPETTGRTADTKRQLGLGFEVLSDVDCAIALRFGTAYRVPDSYRAALLSFGIDLEQRHGDDWWLLPMPAIFVVGQDGILRYAKASGDITDRTEPDAIVQLLRDI